MTGSGTDRSKRTRFRVEIAWADGGWEANVYDHADHGTEQMYAGAWCTSLDRALREAAHYVLVAADDDFCARQS